MNYCANCGTKTLPGERICRRCLARDAATPPPKPEPEEAPPTPAEPTVADPTNHALKLGELIHCYQQMSAKDRIVLLGIAQLMLSARQ